jgi:predicted dehydrogenase
LLTVQEAKEHLDRDMLCRPDLIVLATPPHYRGTMQPGRDLEAQIIATFGSAPHLFCEKPLSTARPAEVWPVATFLRDAGGVVSVGYMLRYLRVVQHAKSILRDNNVTVMAVTARYTMAYSKVRKLDWWNKAKQCGPIVEQATHFCDLCRYLGGEVDLASVRACALEHYEPAGTLSSMAVEESQIPAQDRIPRATAAFWYVTSRQAPVPEPNPYLHGVTLDLDYLAYRVGSQMAGG